MKTCENCKHWIPMRELEGKCVLYGLKHYVCSLAEATCDEWDGDDDDCDEYRRKVWEYDGFEYFGKTEPSKRKLCCTCKHRTLHAAYDTCDIGGHVMGQFEILKRCCEQWEKEKENEG